MKARILGLLILFLSVPFLSVAQLPDMDFENWVNHNLYEEPDDLLTTNIQSYILNSQPNVTKVSGTQGSAARLETVLIGTDTLPGILTNQAGGGSGVAYTETPDSLRISVRYNIQPGDTAGVVCVFTNGGSLVGFGAPFITGSSASFVTIAAPVSMFLPPDSMLFLALSGNIPGSWIEIDHITLTNATQQIANSGLDNWHPVAYDDPQGWTSTNIFSAVYQQPMAVRQNTTDVMSGSNSLEIENTVINFFGEMDTIGFVSNTDAFIGGSNTGSPYSDQPEKLAAYYKYAPVGSDSATIGVLFTKWNSGAGKTDSITANITRLPAASSFTKVELPINWTSVPNPDSVIIVMAAGDLQGFTAQPGSVVIFDDLMFEFPVGISTPVPAFANGVNLYPNPAGEYLYVDLSRTDLQAGHVVIRNILGQVMFEQAFNDTNSPIQVKLGDYRSGTYLYEIREGERILNGKFIVR